MRQQERAWLARVIEIIHWKQNRMSELKEQRWAVMSERGCEASTLTYEEAAALIGRLASEEVRGMCIITNEAAQHLVPVQSNETKSNHK
jgi:hypothetical protein